jgi:hypothetical protein
VIKTLEAQVGQFLLGCKYPVNRGIVVQEQDSLVTYAVTPLIVALSPRQSDIARFRPWSPIAKEISLTKKFQTLLRRLARLTFLIRVQAFRDPLRGELPYVQIFLNDGDAKLLSY